MLSASCDKHNSSFFMLVNFFSVFNIFPTNTVKPTKIELAGKIRINFIVIESLIVYPGVALCLSSY